jgi:hypothetical protein
MQTPPDLVCLERTIVRYIFREGQEPHESQIAAVQGPSYFLANE